MSLLEQAKGMIHIDAITVVTHLPKVQKKGAKEISGSITVIAKRDVDISSITVEVIQYAKIPTKKEGTEDTIGKKTYRPKKHIDMLRSENFDFTIPLSRKAAKKVEKKVYTGDLALLNKVSDQAKKTFYEFTFVVSVKCTGEKGTIQLTKNISFE